MFKQKSLWMTFFLILKSCETNYYDELLNVIKKKRLDIEPSTRKEKERENLGKTAKKTRKHL